MIEDTSKESSTVQEGFEQVEGLGEPEQVEELEGRSKALGSEDVSGFEFVKEMLHDDKTFAVNFDRLQFDKKENKFILFEFLLCEEKQDEHHITPHTSHPNRYWWNKQKFISLWRAAQKLEADLFLVNYAKKDTRHEDEILVIKVLSLDDEKGIMDEKVWKTTREKFSNWFRELNKKCM